MLKRAMKATLAASLLDEFKSLARVSAHGSHRKNPHEAHFHKRPASKKRRDEKAKLTAPTGRRGHKLLSNVAVVPSVVASAQKRARVYMHSAARRRLAAGVV